MADFDFTVSRLRELQIEAKTALDGLASAATRVRSAIDKIESELEHLDYSQISDGGTRGRRPAFASTLQGMCYTAIWIATAQNAATDGVTEEQFLPILERLRDKDGQAPDTEKVPDSLSSGRGKHITGDAGFYRLLRPGLDAVRNHWEKISGKPEEIAPPLPL